MILHDLNAIFVHIPKTAGNFLTRDYLSRFSRDTLIVAGHQDGVDRFEVQGEVTTHKHMTLADYSRSIELRNTFVITTVRDPVERLISAYFSPHRRFRLGVWAKLVSSVATMLNIKLKVGPDSYREEDIVFDTRRFAEFVSGQQTYREYLEGYANAKGLFLLRKESPLEDLNAVLRYLGRNPFKLSAQSEWVNKSEYQLSEGELEHCRRIVMASVHAADYEFIEQLHNNAIEF